MTLQEAAEKRYPDKLFNPLKPYFDLERYNLEQDSKRIAFIAGANYILEKGMTRSRSQIEDEIKSVIDSSFDIRVQMTKDLDVKYERSLFDLEMRLYAILDHLPKPPQKQ